METQTNSDDLQRAPSPQLLARSSGTDRPSSDDATDIESTAIGFSLTSRFPVDLYPLILAFLSDRADLHAAALVSRAFCRAAIPLLYETLDSRLIQTNRGLVIHHPAQTLLARPELAKFVRRVHETGTVHGAPPSRNPGPGISHCSLAALRLCTNLRAFAWVDDHFLPDNILLAFLEVLRALPRPLEELTIRTFGDLGKDVWATLNQMKGLTSVAVFCMEGPPRILQGWSEALGPSLTHLELGRCSGVPTTLLIAVFGHLPLLEHLRIKGAPAAALPHILAQLPRLRELDTDYNVTGGRILPPKPTSSGRKWPRLEMLTFRTSSVDVGGPTGFWQWASVLAAPAEAATALIPDSSDSNHHNASLSSNTTNSTASQASLRVLRLHSFSSLGDIAVPGPFIAFLARTHGPTLAEFACGTTLVSRSDVEYMCSVFPRLEEISCSIANANPSQILAMTLNAPHLRTLRLNMSWYRRSVFAIERASTTVNPPMSLSEGSPGSGSSPTNSTGTNVPVQIRGFTLADARTMMLRPGSVLRELTLGQLCFKGEWVYDPLAKSAGSDPVQFCVQQLDVGDVRREAS